MRFKIKDDETFEINKLEVTNHDKLIESRTRHKLAIGAAAFSAAFLVVTAAYGAVHRDFTALSAVFEHIEMPMGILFGYYFGAKKNG